MKKNKLIKNDKILVIMESPTKTKTVQSYLGNNYIVTSSEGHIRNLSSTGELSLGINLDTFEPKYRLERNKKPIIDKLKKLSKTSKFVILATDYDREGEAIAYHLKEVLKLDDKYKRVTFNEITKNVILEEFQNLKSIDMNLFKSQETRRLLDRMIGYRLSKLLHKKIKSKSAGRVQSVTLKILVDRENEIIKFQSKEYWTITGLYENNEVRLIKFNNKNIKIANEQQVIDIAKKLNEIFIVSNVVDSIKHLKPPKPFKTSTLLQNSATHLNYSPSKTSLLAQQLYEGIKIDNELTGLITYPRTDSQRLSNSFIEKVFKYINEKYGKDYVGTYSFKIEKNMQNAHEAIRPTDINATPQKLKKFLKPDQLKLYTLIYQNSLMSLMKSALYNVKKISFLNNDYEFVINISELSFKGFLIVENKISNDKNLPINLKIGDKIMLEKLVGNQHFTAPPSRYNLASIIKKLEELGIGRPSTYSITISTLQKRYYINIVNKIIKPTEKGILTNEVLQEYFEDIINEQYTSLIENKLDQIAKGQINNILVLKNFWEEFEPRVITALDEIPEVSLEKANMNCPMCEKDLVYRYGPYGKFIACSGFPKCKYIFQKETIIGKCPECQKGNTIIKMNKRKKTKILVCDKYPECKYIEDYKNISKNDTTNKTTETSSYKKIELIEINLLKLLIK